MIKPPYLCIVKTLTNEQKPAFRPDNKKNSYRYENDTCNCSIRIDGSGKWTYGRRYI